MPGRSSFYKKVYTLSVKYFEHLNQPYFLLIAALVCKCIPKKTVTDSVDSFTHGYGLLHHNNALERISTTVFIMHGAACYNKAPGDDKLYCWN